MNNKSSLGFSMHKVFFDFDRTKYIFKQKDRQQGINFQPNL